MSKNCRSIQRSFFSRFVYKTMLSKAGEFRWLFVIYGMNRDCRKGCFIEATKAAVLLENLQFFPSKIVGEANAI